MPAAPATVETGGETKTIDASYPLGEKAYFRNFPGRYRLWLTIHVIAIHVYSGGRGWSVDNIARLLWDAIPLHKSWKSAAQCQRFRNYIEGDVYESYPFFSVCTFIHSRRTIRASHTVKWWVGKPQTLALKRQYTRPLAGELGFWA